MEFEFPIWLKDLILQLWAAPGVQWIVYHSLLNAGVAVGAALKNGNFRFPKLIELFTKKVGPLLCVYTVALLFEDALGYPGIAGVTFAAIESYLWSNLLETAGELGLNLGPFGKLIVRG